MLGLSDRAQIIVGNPAFELKSIDASIVFADPPYDLTREYDALMGVLGQKPPTLVILQHSSKFDPGARHGLLLRYRVLRQGDNSLSFYRTDG